MENKNENSLQPKINVEEVNAKIQGIQDKLDELNKSGETKIRDLKEQISILRGDKTVSKEEKQKTISELNAQVADAKVVKDQNKEAVKSLIAEGKAVIKSDFNTYYKEVKEEGKHARKVAKAEYHEKIRLENEEFKSNLANLPAASNDEEKVQRNAKLVGLKRAHSSRLYEIKLAYKKKLTDIKSDIHDVYLDKTRKLQDLNGGSLTPVERVVAGLEKYVYRFNTKDFFLKNGLYIVMIVVFLICGALSVPMGKGVLLAQNNIFEILNQTSPRIFLALGVAGLILLAGTDLSIGRMVGLGTCITCMFLYPGLNNMPLFGNYLDFTSWPTAARIIVALLVVICCTTLFSSIAGFFSAKFKMHPFISTMGTQLIIFGLLAVVTDSKNTGVIDISIMNSIAGKIGGVFPLLLVYAIIGIIIVSFIWNRTKFGKNMYAVGGNPEAASVSGISVFWITMGVFVMAGILYGLGSFFEGVRIGTAKFDTGTGYETDAIAACVVGGISFTGGIGKIRGAVIGALIFTALTYALTFLGINPFYQYIIKGIIIITAVSLDCLKYLKKK